VDGLSVSDVELTTPGPSYTADTLGRIAAALGIQASQIFFITGADAFAEIETWSRFPEVLELANFVAVSRPGFPAGVLRQRLPALKSRMRLPLRRGDAGLEDGGTSIFLVDAPTTDASSTEIRRRLGAALPLHGLVPGAVEQHLQQHRLYMHQPLITLEADHLHGKN